MNPEEIDDPSKHRFTNPLEAVDPGTGEKEPAQLLWEVLNSDPAKEHFGSIAQITGNERREAGFAVYRTPNTEYEISSLVESVDGPERSANTAAAKTLSMHESLDTASLTHQDPEEAEPKRLRNDLVFIMHSHPAGHDEARVDDWLHPSSVDLESWEEASIANPGLTEAIAVVDGDQMKMLLYRHKPERTLIPYYQQLGDNESRNRVIRVLKESNVDVATLTYDLSKQEFTGESQQALQEFLA